MTAPSQMCMTCGNDVPADATKCPICGAKLRPKEPPVQRRYDLKTDADLADLAGNNDLLARAELGQRYSASGQPAQPRPRDDAPPLSPKASPYSEISEEYLRAVAGHDVLAREELARRGVSYIPRAAEAPPDLGSDSAREWLCGLMGIGFLLVG